MTSFVFANWSFCLATSLLLTMVILWQRFLLIKPSIIMIIFFHLMIQWAAAINSPEIEDYLPNPWVFALLSQGFPFIGLLGSIWIGRRSAYITWKRLCQPQPVLSWARRKALFILGSYVIIFVFIYLQHVPFSRTGLYTIFADPLQSALAREYSLKLQDSAVVRYGYGFLISVFAPLLAVLLADELMCHIKQLHVLKSGILIVTLGGLLVAVSLSGARSFAAMIIFTILFAGLLRRGLPINMFYAGGMVLAVLAFPTLLSILREGRDVSWSLFWEYLQGGIFYRVFYLPMQTGLWFTHYAQTVGFLGVQGVPRLAGLLNVPPVNAANLIGLVYTNSRIASVSANTGYVFAYYCYFGLPSFIFSLTGLWLLDLVLWLYRRIDDNLLLASVAAISIASIKFTYAEYTTVLLTHGFGVLLIVAWGVAYLSRVKFRFKVYPSKFNLASRSKQSIMSNPE